MPLLLALAIGLAIAAGLWLAPAAGSGAWLDRDRLAGSIVLIGCAVLVSRGMWGRWRGRLPQALTAVAFWLALLVVVMALYTWRHDLADFFARL